MLCIFVLMVVSMTHTRLNSAASKDGSCFTLSYVLSLLKHFNTSGDES